MENITQTLPSSEERVLSLKLGDERLVLWRKNITIDGEPSLPSEDSYRIEFNTDYEGSFDELTFPRALMMIIDILSGIGERVTHESGDYAYNKAQIMAIANMYSQSDSQFLIDSLINIHELETKAMKALLNESV